MPLKLCWDIYVQGLQTKFLVCLPQIWLSGRADEMCIFLHTEM